MEQKVVRDDQQKFWHVTGEGISGRVHGSTKFGPKGAVDGKGALNHRTAILEVC